MWSYNRQLQNKEFVDLICNRIHIVGFTYDMSVNLLYLPFPVLWISDITRRMTVPEREQNLVVLNTRIIKFHFLN